MDSNHGGKRPGAGRPKGDGEKTNNFIYVGILDKVTRLFIMDTLTPDERQQALIDAAQDKIDLQEYKDPSL